MTLLNNGGGGLVGVAKIKTPDIRKEAPKNLLVNNSSEH